MPLLSQLQGQCFRQSADYHRSPAHLHALLLRERVNSVRIADILKIQTICCSLPLKRTISYFLENLNRQAERQETLSAIGEPSFPSSLAGVLGKELMFPGSASVSRKELLSPE